MDIDLVRTFLAVLETGNFVRAAERLNVTQSTVSMRVKSLEDAVGRPLFLRGKAGAQPTAAGLRFEYYALTMLRVWEQARQEVALSEGFETVLSVGGQISLWDRLLLKWIPWMRKALPDVAIRAEVDTSEGLMHRLLDGVLDVGVMYNPQARAGFVAEVLLEERLVLVATERKSRAPAEPGYVFVDWGPEFRQAPGQAFAELETPALTVSLGPLGLHHILENGGAGYFPMRLVRPYLAEKKLHRVPKAPEFKRPAYLVYSAEQESERFTTAVQGLRYVAALESEK